MISAVSVLACANLCRYPCSSFFFHPDQQQCILINQHLYDVTDPGIDSDMGWSYYSYANDVDECIDGSANCHADAACTNTIGSFTCVCNAGFSGDGVTCIDTSCPSPYSYVTTENMCLRVESVTKENYDDATAACAVDGAHLFHLDTTAKINAWDVVHQTTYNGLPFYVGLSDKNYAVGDFRWTDGTAYTDHNFNPSQPDNSNNDDCVVIAWYENYKWNDIFCSDKYFYVCELP